MEQGGMGMAYRIEYPGKKKAKRFPVWIVLPALGGLALLRQRLGQFLLPGDPEVTGRALETLLAQLRQGIGAGEAVSAFCKAVVQGAGIG